MKKFFLLVWLCASASFGSYFTYYNYQLSDTVNFEVWGGYGWGSGSVSFLGGQVARGSVFPPQAARWRIVQGTNTVYYFPTEATNSFPPPAVTNAPLPDTTAPKDANIGDPINFISGNNHFSWTEISLPAPGVPLGFSRYYNSIATNSSVFGKGWRHSYDWSMAIESNTAAVTSGDARIYTFDKDSNGVYSASFDNNWQLSGPTNGAYVLSLPGANAYRFNASGVLQSISDGWGNTVSLAYSNGLLHSAGHDGQSIEFTYSNGLLSAVTAATNLSVSFSYSTNGALINAVRQAGSEQSAETYSYNAALLLTQRVDAVGSDYHYAYSTNNKAIGMFLTDDRWYEFSVAYSNALSRAIFTRGGEELVHDYDYNSTTKRVLEERFANATGKVTYAYDNGGNVTNQTTYDANTNRWMQICRLYDDRHNVTNEAFGLSATPTNITKYTWHPQWQTLISVTDPEGFKQEYEYTNGAIVRSRIYLSSNTTVETAYGYTTNGLLSAVTNANGHSTTFTYDTLGYPQSVIPQAGPTVTFGYDSLGHLTSSAMPGGRNTGYTVNPLGWVERIDYADGLYETFRYNGLGKVTNQVDRAGRVASYAYAPGGKLTAVSRQLGSTNVTVSYTFDQQFNTLAIRDELNRPVESYALDPQDRPTTVTNLEGQTMSIRYLVGDFVDSITRFDNTVVSNQYNGDGRLTAVSYPGETNRYTHLRNGLVQTLENSKGSVSNSWNGAGWIIVQKSVIGNLQSAISNAYDLAGNVTNSSVNLQSTIINRQYSYDQAERLKEIFTTEGTETQRFAYAYNPDNGLVASVSNGNLRAEYQYDIMDRITSIDWKNAWGATILAFDYQYNAAGMITNVVKNDGLQLSVKSYQYDDLDRLTGEASFAGSAPLRENSYSYDAAGNRLSKQNFDSTVSYTLGAGNRLASWSATSANNFLSARTMRVQGHSSEPIGTDSRWGQLYVSNTVAVVPNVNGTNFWVNSFVTGLGAQKVVAAIRDQAGNVGYATNEIFLTVVTNGAYQYSAAGCVTNIAYTGADYAQTTKLGWDSQYRLASVTSVSSACPELAERVVNYSYDVLGRRMSRTVAGGGDPGFTNVEHYVYAGDQVVADLNASGNLLRTYTWGPGVDNLLALTTYGAETNTYYAVKDHLNSVHALVDEAGQIVERYEYDAWGRVLDMKDASGNSIANHQSAIGNRYLWQGREYDAVTALYYFRARWYDPVSGRWLSKDPIGISGGLNQYVFCSNNPVNFIDPDGLVVTIATRAILAGIAVHSFVDVTDSSGVTLYSGTNEPGNKNDLGVRKNYLPDVNAKINSRVLVPPPPNMTQAQWDAAVRSSGETTLKRHLKRNYAALGGDGGKTSGNCHVVTKEIVEGAGGSIPAGYEPPAAHPGLH